MRTFLKFCLFAFILMSNFIMFAQPGDDDGSGGLEGTDPQPADIDNKLFLLLFLGIIFAFFTLKKNLKKA